MHEKGHFKFLCNHPSKDVLAKAMKLQPNQHIILAQCVGFPLVK